MVKYAILGPVELCDSERRMAVGGPRQVALLALLLVHANRALSNDWLIETLWGDLGPAGALKRLQAAILRLRRALDREGLRDESVLRTVAGGYLLVVHPGELDAEVFETRMQDGRRALEVGDATRARGLLYEALEMWHGPPLADVAYEEFAQPEIRRLEELRLAALEARVESELQLGEHSGLIAELEALVATHPGHERLAAQLMLALYRCGRQGDALDVYTRTRTYLAGELGLEPGPALQTLQAEILIQSAASQRVRNKSGTAAVLAAERSVGGGSDVAVEPMMLELPRSLQLSGGLPFVGREVEIALLHERWRHVRRGERSAVAVGGDAGIGKTRLASEFSRVVHEQGALVLYGRCDEGLAVPYQPFVDALRPYACKVGLDRLHAELGDLAPELGRLLPELGGLGEPSRGDPESQRYALFEAVTALIEAMTRDQPTLLIFDDLQWAAPPTLLLLRHLIRSERSLAALVLAAYRETELVPGHQLAQLLADLHRDASAEQLSIGGLRQPAIAALLEAAVGQALDESTLELARVLEAQTAGNPFFVRELLTHLAESGGQLSLDVTAAQLEAPEGLRQMIGHRVARLSRSTKEMLRLAAVAGSTFSFVLLERVLGEESGVIDTLDDAVATGWLAETGHGDYVFAHALVRQTIYDQLTAARRMRLHRQLGEAIEALDDTDGHVESLAYHFAQAAADGQCMKAADYALAAGHSAMLRLGYEEAAAHYERGLQALRLTAQPQEQQRCELLLALGEARWGAGELDKARTACGQAAELADKLRDATALARAALGSCGPHRAEVAAAITLPVAHLLQRALAALGEEDSALRARLMGRVAATLAYTSVEHRVPLLAHRALKMARRVEDKATLADVLASNHWATRGPDALDESLALAAELERVADEVSDIQLQAAAHVWLHDHGLELGDIAAAKHGLDALQRLVMVRKERNLTRILTTLQASHALLAGRVDECEALAHKALTHRFEGHDDQAPQIFGIQILFVRSEQGRLDELLEPIESFIAQYPEMISWRYALLAINAQLDRRTPARQELESLSKLISATFRATHSGFRASWRSVVSLSYSATFPERSSSTSGCCLTPIAAWSLGPPCARAPSPGNSDRSRQRFRCTTARRDTSRTP